MVGSSWGTARAYGCLAAKLHLGLLTCPYCVCSHRYYPETQYRFAPVFAVSGGETFWFGANNKPSPFRPTSHELMALHRVMAYQRPYMPLQDSGE